MVERKNGKVGVHEIDRPSVPGQISLGVSKARPAVRGKEERLIEDDNIDTLGKDIISAIRSEKKVRLFGRIRRALESGDIQGIYTVTAGMLTIFVAAAGFEFGIRHGKDIRHLEDILRGHRPDQPSQP